MKSHTRITAMSMQRRQWQVKRNWRRGKTFPGTVLRPQCAFHKARPQQFMIVLATLLVTMLVLGCITHALLADGTPKATTISRDTVVLTFASRAVTAGELDQIKVGYAQAQFQKGVFQGTAAQDQLATDYMYFTAFDNIEISKQLTERKLASAAELVKQIAPLPQIDDKTAHEFYRDHQHLFARSAPQIRVREIAVRDSHLAYQLLDKLHVGASFEQLAQQYSVDPSTYRDRGGDMGWIVEGHMPIEWDTVAFTLKPGQTSTVFKAAGMWYILQGVEGIQIDIAPFESANPAPSTIAAQYAQSQQFHQWLSSLILNEPINVIMSSYSDSIAKAMGDLRANPAQTL